MTFDPHVQPPAEHVDPLEWTPLIEAAFFARLVEVLAAEPVPESASLIVARARDAHRDLVDALTDLVRNPMDEANVRCTTLVVAGFRVLAPVCGRARAAAIVDDCLNSPLRELILGGTAAMLDAAPDPFAALVAAGKDREVSYFGPSFTFERPVDDHDTYVLDITRCLFHETLAAVGHRELQPILCRFDLNWADAVDPARHHTTFERPVTFASGPVCRMIFARREHLDGLLTGSGSPEAPAG